MFDNKGPVIAPDRDGWSKREDNLGAVLSLEEAVGCLLPQDYRDFLLEYNGGAPYPQVFRFAPDPEDPDRFLDRLHSAEFAQQLFVERPFGDNLPTGTLIIGEDPGGLQLLLSLRAEDLGRVHALYPVDASPLVTLADSFRDFLRLLHETEDGIGFEHWHTPARRAHCRKLL